jgi:hypothetical protein
MNLPSRSLGLSTIVGGVAAAFAACAPVAAPPGPIASVASGQCFFSSTISGFKPAASGTALNVRSATSGVYRLDLASPCGDLRAAERILIDSRASGPAVCPGGDVRLIVSSPAGARSCPGVALRKLSEAEAGGLPAAERP